MNLIIASNHAQYLLAIQMLGLDEKFCSLATSYGDLRHAGDGQNILIVGPRLEDANPFYDDLIDRVQLSAGSRNWNVIYFSTEGT